MNSNDGEKKTILVVDDDKEIIRMERMLFSLAGYSVITALNGWDCMRVLATGEKPGIVILDIMMPEQSGYEVYKKIRANPENNAMPVLFYTALSAQELKNIVTLSEQDRHALKSIDPDELVERVGEMVSNKS
jgi:CheY-like chemotaxis protein